MVAQRGQNEDEGARVETRKAGHTVNSGEEEY